MIIFLAIETPEMRTREKRRMMKKSLRSICVALSILLFRDPASAQSGQNQIAASISVASDWVWRGLSQTEGYPALIGEVKWNHTSGFFLGAVAANFSSDKNGDSGVALIPFFGFNRTVGDVNFDAGFLHREYVGASNRNIDEISLSAGFKIGSINIRPGLFYDARHYLPGNPIYLYVDGRTKLAQIGDTPVSLSIHLGTFNAQGSANDYSTWQLGLSAPAGGITYAVKLSNADIDARRSGLEGSRHGGKRLIVSAFKLF